MYGVVRQSGKETCSSWHEGKLAAVTLCKYYTKHQHPGQHY